MPRIAPQLNGKPAAIEHRITMGDLERKLTRESLEKQQTQFYIKQATVLAGSIALPAGIAFAGYFLGMGITNIANSLIGNSIDDMSSALANNITASRGRNPDNSYPTLLAISEPEITRYNNERPLGSVRVYSGTSVIGIGGIAASFFLLNKQSNEISVMGNFNPNATNVNQLSEGWLPVSQWEEANQGYEYEGSRDYDGGAEMTPTETPWSILGYTYEEWKEQGEPISQQWIDYMKTFPEVFSQKQIEAAERLMTQQNENPAYDAEGEGSYHQGEYTNVTICSIQGLTYAEWVAAGMPVTQEWLDWVAEH